MSDEPTTDDEIVSAYLDGEVTPEDAARVEADPVLSARAAALDAVRRQLAVGAAPAGLLDDHVEAALAAFDDASAPPVADLSARRRLWERVPLGAVAAAVVVLALFGALTQLDSGDDDTSMDVATEALDTDDSAGGESPVGDEDSARDRAALDDAEGGGGSETFSTGATGTVLEFSDTDELADHVVATYPDLTSGRAGDGSAAGSDPAPDAGFEAEEQASDACEAVEVAGADPATVTAVLQALVGGVPVTAVVTDGSPDIPVRRLVVVDERTCSVIDDRPL